MRHLPGPIWLMPIPLSARLPMNASWSISSFNPKIKMLVSGATTFLPKIAGPKIPPFPGQRRGHQPIGLCYFLVHRWRHRPKACLSPAPANAFAYPAAVVNEFFAP